MKRLFKLLPLAALLAFQSQPGLAADDELQLIKKELLSLISRIESLEAENQQLRQVVSRNEETISQASTKQKKSSWTDTIKLSGELRTRHETSEPENGGDREGTRVRARLAISAKPTDDLEVGIGLASGGTDPVSTNQTLGSAASTKDIRLDLAYFKWQAKPGLTLIGGKMKNVYFKPGGNPLLWDGDLRPEGMALTYKGDNFFLNGGAHFLESDSRRSNNAMTLGLQAGYVTSLGFGKLTAGASYFTFDTKGEIAYLDDFAGNTFTCPAGQTTDCRFAKDFDEIELFAQLSTSLGEKPLTLFADYAQNQDASDYDSAWAIGLKFGKASSPGTWELGYTYQDVEADAVFGLWNDSDFGSGVTDSKGHILKGAWALNKKSKIGFTYFDNEVGVDLGAGDDYERLQLDWSFKF